MLRFRYIFIFILFIMLIGCSTVRPQFVDQTGRLMPNPSYRLQSIGYPISTVFYYTAFEEIKDVDGTVVKVPRYLDFLSTHDIFAKNIKAITLTIEINNPNGLEYSLYQQMTVKGRKLNDSVQMGGTVNISKLKYRQFVYNLPYGKDVVDVDHYISLMVNGDEVIRIGHFQYHLIH